MRKKTRVTMVKAPKTRGKSAMAASRTGVPPAHGARRQGKTPGPSAPVGAFQTTVAARRKGPK